MKLINEELKGLKLNISGKIHQVDDKGILELEDKESAKVLCETSGFKLMRSQAPSKDAPVKDAPAKDSKDASASDNVEPDQDADQDGNDEEAQADAEAEKELGKEPAKEEKKSGKWLPGKNNKNK